MNSHRLQIPRRALILHNFVVAYISKLNFFETYRSRLRGVHNGNARLNSNKGIVRMERRLHTRHRARTTVYVVMSGRKSRICKAKNLSANGVFVETENLGLRKGQQVQLAFAINLGLVTKIHRRTAIVAHVTRGGTGLMMEQFAGR
jgi:hypothetical protein